MIISISGQAGSGKDLVGRIIQGVFANYSKDEFQELLQRQVQTDETHWQIKKFATKVKQTASLLTGVPIEKWEDSDFKNSYMGSEWDKIKVTYRRGNGEINELFLNNEQEAEEYIAIVEKSNVIDVSYRAITHRQFLQWLGTDAIRNGLHENAWVNGLMSEYSTPYLYTDDQVWEKLSQMGYDIDLEPSELCELAINEGFDWNDDLQLWKFDEDNIEESKFIITDTRFHNELQAVKDRNGICIRVNRESVETNDVHPSENEWKDWEFDYILENNADIPHLVTEVEKTLKHFKLI